MRLEQVEILDRVIDAGHVVGEVRRHSRREERAETGPLVPFAVEVVFVRLLGLVR